MIAAMRVVMRVVISLRVATALVCRPGRGTPRVSGSLRTGRRLVAPVAALRTPPVAAALRSTAELRLEAYEWTANYAAPASLVAGAVIASFYDVENDATMDAHVEDHAWVRVAKKGVKLLLMSAFALELLTVFITTITGTMLLSDASVELCVDSRYSTRLQRARTRTVWTDPFGRASRTRREQSMPPKISRIDFDVTERESSEVWWGPPKPVVDFHTGSRTRSSPRSCSSSPRSSSSSGATTRP